MTYHRSIFALVSAATLLAACSKGENAGTPKGARATAEVAATADTGNALGATGAVGGAAAVTATDANSVARATKYRLTEDNFNKFVAATDSLSALRTRDTAIAAFLAQQITDNGSGTRVTATNAGLLHLESNPAVSAAINGAGMSVRDYFVAAIAIAQAERFMGNPKSAPPTPTLGPNAAFLNAHKPMLQHIHAVQRTR